MSDNRKDLPGTEEGPHDGDLWSCPCSWCERERADEVGSEQRASAQDWRTDQS